MTAAEDQARERSRLLMHASSRPVSATAAQDQARAAMDDRSPGWLSEGAVRRDRALHALLAERQAPAPTDDERGALAARLDGIADSLNGPIGLDVNGSLRAAAAMLRRQVPSPTPSPDLPTREALADVRERVLRVMREGGARWSTGDPYPTVEAVVALFPESPREALTVIDEECAGA